MVNSIIHSIALLIAIRKSRLILISMLIVEFFIRHYHRYGLSSLLILLILVIGPFITEQYIKHDKTKQYANELPNLCKHHRYQYKEMVAELLVCGLCLLLLLAYFIANLNSSIEEAYIIYSPIAYMTVAIITFTVLYFTEKKKIGTILENNLL